GQHFVDIVDPDGFRVRSLQQFHSFEIRGYAVDPPEEESGLNLMVGDAGLLLTDAAGRTTGYDLQQGAIQQIPNSSATIESFDLVAPAAPDDGFSSHITITNPDAGSYRLA